MRDILNTYFDDGTVPDWSNKDLDCFWDPPEPLLIGQSIVQLAPLSYVSDNHLTAQILSVEGVQGSRGQLTCGYWPCKKTG